MHLGSEQLMKMGLTKGESNVYIALIELGSSTVGPIVKKSGIAYSNIYEVLQRLMGKGLASFVVRNKVKYFQAAEPDALKTYLERQEKDFLENYKIVEKIIPLLNEMRKNKPEQEAEIYLGLKGLQAAYTKTLKEHKGEWLWFYQHHEEMIDIINALTPLYKRLVKSQKIVVKGIANRDYTQTKIYRQMRRLQKTRFISFPTPGNIDIIGNSVIISSFRKPFVVFIIKSEAIANDMRNYFYSVWKVAKP
ncbi:MAG: hypothetical protein HY514_05030 [Candidatus Aenigmarchaeota archaeon]|nr:hypothetical protein [Candidatus Aenigmarchaeota archaeon]